MNKADKAVLSAMLRERLRFTDGEEIWQEMLGAHENHPEIEVLSRLSGVWWAFDEDGNGARAVPLAEWVASHPMRIDGIAIGDRVVVRENDDPTDRFLAGLSGVVSDFEDNWLLCVKLDHPIPDQYIEAYLTEFPPEEGEDEETPDHVRQKHAGHVIIDPDTVQVEAVVEKLARIVGEQGAS